MAQSSADSSPNAPVSGVYCDAALSFSIALLEEVGDLVAAVNSELCLVAINSAFSRNVRDRMGMTPQLGMPIEKVLAALTGDPEKSRGWCRMMAAGEPIKTVESLRLGGTLQPVAINVARMGSRHGKSAWTGIVIHAAGLAQTSLANPAELLQVLQHFPGLPWSAAADGKIDRLGPQWSAYSGLSSEALSAGWIAAVHPEDHERVLQEWHAALARARPFSVEARICDGSGHDNWFALRAVRQSGEDARPPRWFGLCVEIERLKQEQDVLRTSEERFRLLSDNISQLAWIADADGAISWCNKRWLDYTGMTEQEVQGLGWQKVHHPQHLQRVVHSFHTALASGTEWQDAFPMRRHDGNYRWFLTRAVPVRSNGSRTLHWFGTNTDITELREAEEDRERILSQLRVAAAQAVHNRAQLEAVFQTIGDGVAVFDMHGSLVLFNAAHARIHGPESVRDRENHLAYCARTYVLLDTSGKPLPLSDWPAARVLRGDVLQELEVRVQTQGNESPAFLSFSGAPVHEESGRQILAVLVTRDITDRKRMEQARQESERRLQLAVSIAKLGSWEWDVAGDACYFSPQWKKQLGYRNDEIADRLEEWTSRLHADDRERVGQELAAFIDEPATGCQLSFRLRHRDGSYRYMETNAIPALSASGGLKLIGTQLDVTDARQAEQRVLEAALHDPLTGLPNRALVFEYAGHMLAAAHRKHGRGAFLFIDLDRFKPINDVYGHEIGDRLLQEVARRISACVRKEDLVGRLGGDEFVAVLPHASTAAPAGVVAQHILDALAQPITIQSLDLSVSASVGISYFPEHGGDVDALIHAADLAMYHAKHRGRGAFQTYSADIDNQASESARIEGALKRALRCDGLALHYQPVVDIGCGRIIGAEALLRLCCEDGQVIEPARFIPVAEATGMIGEIGEWVATEACRQHAAWCAEGLRPVSIAINVSPLQFRQRGFAQRLEAIVQNARIDPSFIQLEVTESTVMESVEDAALILHRIRAMGMRIALDDFGTGYSSLSHLSNLPLDKLKVDQSFVRRLKDDAASRAITGAIIALGRTLKLEMVGEGIETEDALTYLREHGCDQAQGYLISHPLPPAAFAEWMESNRRQTPGGAPALAS